jgi:serine/threonine-protein kinase
MMTADLGACEWFVRDLHGSNLVERGRLEQLVEEFLRNQPRAEPEEMADFLVKQQVLTPFQADSVLQGKTENLVLGPFLVTEMIGFGSMGTVYKGQSKVDKQWYAVKVLPNRGVLKLRNAKQIARDFKQLKHPSIVPFFDAGAGGSSNYLAWPFVDGGMSLEKLVTSRGHLSSGLAAHYVAQTAEGLAMCHEKNLTHGLLKPANILVKADHSALVLDLGMGTLLGQEESVIHTGGLANLAASADYSAPETALNPTDAGTAGDQYSLGCILYFCLTGSCPFVADNYVTKMVMHQTQQPPPVREKNPDVPDGLLTVLERMMAKKAEDRYATLFDAAAALKPFAKAEASPAFQAPETATAPKKDGAKVERAPARSAPVASAPPKLPDQQPAAASPVPWPEFNRQALFGQDTTGNADNTARQFQKSGPTSSSTTKTLVFGLALIIICVGLGMAIALLLK